MKTIIGLTGGYCTGKNEAASSLETMGFSIIDVDKLGHVALERSAAKLAEVFGPSILKADGSVDRRALGAMVFSSPARLALHESIVHPPMLELLDQAIAAGDRVCINAALLYRFPQKERCTLILEVRAPLCERIRRGRERDGLGVRDILTRIASQRYLWRMRPEVHPPVLFLDNGGDLDALKRDIGRILASDSPRSVGV